MRPSVQRDGRGSGFTVVELVVTLTVIGVLTALLLPAVQSSRETARRVECRNHLRQIALAVAAYHTRETCFPLAYHGAPNEKKYDYQNDGFGWGVALLPFLDQMPLYDAIAPRGEFGVFTKSFRRSGKPYDYCDTRLGIYRCPSSALPDLSTDLGPVPNHPKRLGYATSDYKACLRGLGDGIIVPNGKGPVRFRDVTDGASQTIIVGEASFPGPFGKRWPIWAGAIGYREMVAFETDERAPINCGMSHRGEMFWESAWRDHCAASFHAGGAQFAFADGHVRFLSETIDGRIYYVLGSRSDGYLHADF